MVDGGSGETPVAEVEDRYPVGRAEAALYRADSAQAPMGGMSLDVFPQPVDGGRPRLGSCRSPFLFSSVVPYLLG